MRKNIAEAIWTHLHAELYRFIAGRIVNSDEVVTSTLEEPISGIIRQFEALRSGKLHRLEQEILELYDRNYKEKEKTAQAETRIKNLVEENKGLEENLQRIREMNSRNILAIDDFREQLSQVTQNRDDLLERIKELTVDKAPEKETGEVGDISTKKMETVRRSNVKS